MSLRAAANSSARRGLTLVEITVCTLLVSVTLVGAMTLLGEVVSSRTSNRDRARAHQMAQQLMTEILDTSYKDATSPVFGPEAGEATGTRVNFDDVDDYHSWTASPPQSRGGTALTNANGWRHRATVEWISLATPSTVSVTDAGAKRVTVTIERNSLVVAELVAVRSDKYKP